jgi:trans-aconitate 2-methyltransferase
VLHERFDAAETVGVDSSRARLAAAPADEAGLRFEVGDIAGWTTDDKVDLIFASASLQWLPGQPRLLTRVAQLLADRGQIALQMPANDDHPSHVVAAELAAEEPYRAELAGYFQRPPVLAPETYAELLHDLGYDEQQVRLQVYPLEFDDAAMVVEWVGGSLLGDYRAPVAAAVRALRRRLPRAAAGAPRPRAADFYPYKRLLF